MPHKNTSVWLSRVLFESALITISIVVALALDEWRDNRQDQQIVEHAMENFLAEVRLNKARVEDSLPFNSGLRDVLAMRHASGDIGTVAEFVSMVESYTPDVLQVTAWETAVATGALSKMDYDLVSAMSLTYSLQNRYEQTVRVGAAELTSPQNLSSDKLDLAAFNAIRYLNEVTRIEVELAATYAEAAATIERTINRTAERDGGATE
jgi:hypothetical protein